MFLTEFRETLLDSMIRFLWRQWSALGVMGEAGTEDNWVLDPEPLLIFSLEIARYEPRLFDEITAWLLVNGQWLDTARMRRLLKQQDERAIRVIGGTLQYVLSNGNERKWRNLAKLCENIFKKQPRSDWVEVLFKEKSGKDHPVATTAEPHFSIFYINRPKIDFQRKSREVPINAKTNIRFLLRALFGIGGKSESVLYLLTHEGGRPREIADSVGLFWLSIQNSLLELSKSGLILTRTKGKKTEYWISHKKWWEFLAASVPETTLKWLNWSAVFEALSVVWKTIDKLASGKESDYMKSSKLQDSLEVLSQEFARAGYDMPRLPTMGIPSELHQEMALTFLSKLLGVKNE